MRVRSCKGEGLALLNYQARGKARGEDKKESDREGRSFDTGLCDSQIGRMCLRDVKALQKMPEKLRTRCREGHVLVLRIQDRKCQW
jgi:hypothetical protein